MRKKLGDVKPRVFAFVYSDTGAGKTRLAMSIAEDSTGKGVAYVTPEEAGLMSLASAGYSADIPYELVGTPGEDPFPECVSAIEAFARDKTISTICFDGASVVCGRAVDFLSGGEGDKALGWDGWGQVFNGFRQIEAALDAAARLGKSVVVTAWADPPTYEETEAGRSVKKQGGPWIQGRGRVWLPGNADFIGHMESKMERAPNPVTKRMEEKWVSKIQVHPSDEWLCKTRLTLPMYVPNDLRVILAQSSKLQTARVNAAATKVVKPVVAATPTRKDK